MIENHMPSSPKKIGIIKTEEHWKSNVLRKAIVAEVKPSFRAVKNAEPNIEIPENKKAIP